VCVHTKYKDRTKGWLRKHSLWRDLTIRYAHFSQREPKPKTNSNDSLLFTNNQSSSNKKKKRKKEGQDFEEQRE